jgi:hypothetical protein
MRRRNNKRSLGVSLTQSTDGRCPLSPLYGIVDTLWALAILIQLAVFLFAVWLDEPRLSVGHRKVHPPASE